MSLSRLLDRVMARDGAATGASTEAAPANSPPIAGAVAAGLAPDLDVASLELSATTVTVSLSGGGGAVRVATSITFAPASSFTPTAGGSPFPVIATVLDQFGVAMLAPLAPGVWASQNTQRATLTQNGRSATVTPLAAGPAVLTYTVQRAGLADLVGSVQVGVGAIGAVTDGVVTLPGARLDAMVAAVEPVPDWASVPSNRRFVVAGNTEQALLDAVYAACAYTAQPGIRLVVLPDGYRPAGGVYCVVPANAQPGQPVIVVPASVANGTVALRRWKRVPEAGFAWMPVLENKDKGFTAGYPVFEFPRRAGLLSRDFFVYGCQIRFREDAADSRDCGWLVDAGLGEDQPPMTDATQAPRRIVFSHCVVGGRKFTTAGRWRQNNARRVFYDYSAGLAVLDSWCVELGGPGGGYSDAGFLNATWGQGPIWVENCATDYGGGIPFFTGGTDVPDSWPNVADVRFRRNYWTRRASVYHPTEGQQDSAGNRCNWTHKPQLEIKDGERVEVTQNIFDGQWESAQAAAVGFKANNQDGGGRLNATFDLAFTENLVRSRCGGAYAVLGEAINGGQVNAMERLLIRDNVIQFGTDGVNHYSRCGFYLTPHNPGGQNGVRVGNPRDILVVNNLFDNPTGTDGTNGSDTFIMASTSRPMGADVQYARNIIVVRPLQPQKTTQNDADTLAEGLAAQFRAEVYPDGLPTVQDNAYLVPGGALSNAGSYGALQKLYASHAAMGLDVSQRAQGRYALTIGSPLVTGAAGGARIGPNFVINTLLDRIVSGDWTA